MLGFPGCPLMSIVVNTICAFIFIKFLLHLVIIYMYMHVYMWRTTCMSWFSPCSVPGTELGHQAWRLNPLSHSLVQAHFLCAFSWVSSKEVGLTERNSTCMWVHKTPIPERPHRGVNPLACCITHRRRMYNLNMKR